MRGYLLLAVIAVAACTKKGETSAPDSSPSPFTPKVGAWNNNGGCMMSAASMVMLTQDNHGFHFSHVENGATVTIDMINTDNPYELDFDGNTTFNGTTGSYQCTITCDGLNQMTLTCTGATNCAAVFTR